jgi:formate-dependent nitrite reductase membrane component NrfD
VTDGQHHHSGRTKRCRHRGIAGGVASWLITLADTGVQPLIYLTCGVYAGIACGGIIGAVTAGRRQAQVEYAFGRRP